ncbi:hypothetical protein CBF17_019020 [Pantoea agglomerans]|nr:hypothetical protein CBF17_019020 [Pantoea agglomerans]
MVQIGEITAGDLLFSGINLLGAQIMPESGLLNGGSAGVSLDLLLSQAGIAKVWQAGILLKTFQVTAGMNKLSDIPAINQSEDFDIISHDQSVNRQQQTLPYIQAKANITLADAGTSLAVRRLRLTDEQFPILLYLTSVWPIHTFSIT